MGDARMPLPPFVIPRGTLADEDEMAAATMLQLGVNVGGLPPGRHGSG